MNADILQQLTEFKQEHLLDHLSLMNAAEQKTLLDDVRTINLDHTARLYATYRKTPTSPPDCKILEAPDVLGFESGTASVQEKKRLRRIGEDRLRQGGIAVFLVAGGQGTRLGFDGPKGCYRISPIKRKSLFQLFAETIRDLQNRYGKPLHWYIMTSGVNHTATLRFFDTHSFFGLAKDTVHFITQKQLPALDRNGRLIISPDKRIFHNPNGHGGSIYALHESGALKVLSDSGVEEIFYFQVDNPLAKIADPLFIGAHVDRGAEMSTKVVRKTEPGEKVGVIGRINGKLGCIEYSELTDGQKSERLDDGSLRFKSANIAIHMLKRSFLEKLTSDTKFVLPYHVAVKEIECLEVRGKKHVPAKIEGIKFEMFIFDALGMADTSVTLEVSRADEFSPVKNRSGADSPQTARNDMIGMYRRWLRGAVKDVKIPEELLIEVSPLFAPDEETFKKKFKQSSQITSPLYLE